MGRVVGLMVMLRCTIEPRTKGRLMPDEDDVIEVVEEVEVDVLVDDRRKPSGSCR